MMRRIRRELATKAVIGMIHVPALPGSISYDCGPYINHYDLAMEELAKRPLQELKIYQDAGVDAIMLENMHDVPYARPPLASETVHAMTLVAKAIRRRTQLPIGIQMLEAANCEAMEIAAAADLDFIRAEGYVYAHIGGAGLIEGSARKILELRKKLGVTHINVFADVKKKHCAHALTADLSVGDIVKQSDFFCADGIIITGHFTGEPASNDDLLQARKAAPHLPLLIGSGITAENLHEYFDHADGFIIGSYFKKDGYWKNDIDPDRVGRLMEAKNQLLRS